jgi:hypothetical protein
MRKLIHSTLNVTAPEAFWRAAGVTVYSNTDAITEGQTPHRFESYLVRGIVETQSHDERALIWAMNEIKRETEERARVAAIGNATNAVSALAVALQRQCEGEEMQLLRQLPESTKTAIRQLFCNGGRH